MVSGIVYEIKTRDSKPTWCAVRRRRTSGVPAILGRWQFVQRCVGRFGIYCNYRGSNPGLRLQQTRRLCHPCIGCISRGPKHDRVVFAKAPVGHSLRRESVTHWNVDATSHSFDKHVLEHKNCVRYRLPRRCDLDTNYGHDHWWPSHWRWNGKTG